MKSGTVKNIRLFEIMDGINVNWKLIKYNSIYICLRLGFQFTFFSVSDFNLHFYHPDFNLHFYRPGFQFTFFIPDFNLHFLPSLISIYIFYRTGFQFTFLPSGFQFIFFTVPDFNLHFYRPDFNLHFYSPRFQFTFLPSPRSSKTRFYIHILSYINR